MGRLEGKTALVTGAASGIGLQTSIRLAEESALVMMTDINLEEGRQQAEKLGANATFLKLDITEEEEWISVLARTEIHSSSSVMSSFRKVALAPSFSAC